MRVTMKRLPREVIIGLGEFHQYAVAVDGRPVGTLFRAVSDEGGHRHLDGWYLSLDDTSTGLGQTWYASLPDARDRIPEQLGTVELFDQHRRCKVCQHLEGDHEVLSPGVYTCDDDCDEDLNGYCHVGRL